MESNSFSFQVNLIKLMIIFIVASTNSDGVMNFPREQTRVNPFALILFSRRLTLPVNVERSSPPITLISPVDWSFCEQKEDVDMKLAAH